MKPSLFTYFGLAFCIIALNSCQSTPQYNLGTTEGIAQITELINKEIEKSIEINSILFTIDNASTFSNNVASIIFSLGSSKNTADNEPIILPYKIEQISIDTKSDKKISIHETTALGKRNATTIDQFDFSKIVPYLEESMAYIPEKYEYRGIGSYTLTMTLDDYIKHNFSIQITAKEGATK